MKILQIGILLSILICPGVACGYGIFGTGGTSEDSISISITLTDSLGNPAGISADSFYICVIGPSGDSIKTIAGDASTSGLEIDSLSTEMVGWKYLYVEAINKIDGSGRAGTYELTFCAKSSNPEYVNCARTNFQIVSSNLSTQLATITTILDSVMGVLDSVQNHDDWVSSFDASADTVMADAVGISSGAAAEAADSVWGHLLDTAWAGGTFGDSAKGWGATSAGNLDSSVVQRIVNRHHDSAQNANIIAVSGDSAAADNLETMLDGTGGQVLSLRQLRIIGTGPNDTAVIATGSGSGIGLYVEGGSSGEGLMAKGHGGRHAIYGFVQDGNGWGLYLRGVGPAGGVCVDADSAGHAVWFKGGINSGNALKLSASNGCGLEAIGGGGYADIAADISGTITSADSVGSKAVDAVWDELQAGHTTSGTFGNYLDAPISGIESSSGSGTYPVTVIAYDSSSNQVVPGVRLSVYNQSVSALIAIGATDTDGELEFNLDADGYVLSSFAPGYIFSAYDTITVTGSQIDSIIGYRFDPGDPGSPDLCRVYGFFYGIDGLPIEGVDVTAELTEGVVRYESTIISPYMRSATSDSTGYFYIDLIPSSGLNPSGTEYRISASYPAGIVLKKKLIVPDQPNWQLDW